MILKVVINEEDKIYEYHEISCIYTEKGYLEGALKKDGTALERELIVHDGQYWVNKKATAECGDDYWETIQVLTDAGSVLWEVKKSDIKLAKVEVH